MPSLRDLVERMGADLMRVAIAPAGLSARFARLAIFDPLERPAFKSDDLVFGVGLAADAGAALEVVQAAPGALLLRHLGEVTDALLSEAQHHGVAVLTVPTACSWSHLHEICLSLPEQDPVPGGDSSTGGRLTEDLFVLANALAEVVGAPITIEDNQSRLLAYSARHEGADEARLATILGHRVPDAFRKEVRRQGIAKRLLTETDPFFISSSIEGIRSRSVIAVRARDQVLGSIWAMTEAPLSDQRIAAFVDGAKAVATRLLHQRLTTDLQRQHQAATLARMLKGGAPGIDAGRVAGLHGEVFRVVAVTARDEDGDVDDVVLDACWSGLTLPLSVGAEVSITARLDEATYSVIACRQSDELGLADVNRAVEGMLSALDAKSRPRVVVGISGTCSLGELPAAREDADRVVRVLRKMGRLGTSADVDEVGLQVTLLRLADLERQRRAGRESVLDRIDDFDTQHDASYGRTLRAYLSAFGDPTLASRELGVHTNTLRYRLRRLAELFDLDLGSEDVRFALMVDLRLRQL